MMDKKDIEYKECICDLEKADSDAAIGAAEWLVDHGLLEEDIPRVEKVFWESDNLKLRKELINLLFTVGYLDSLNSLINIWENVKEVELMVAARDIICGDWVNYPDTLQSLPRLLQDFIVYDQ